MLEDVWERMRWWWTDFISFSSLQVHKSPDDVNPWMSNLWGQSEAPTTFRQIKMRVLNLVCEISRVACRRCPQNTLGSLGSPQSCGLWNKWIQLLTFQFSIAVAFLSSILQGNFSFKHTHISIIISGLSILHSLWPKPVRTVLLSINVWSVYDIK